MNAHRASIVATLVAGMALLVPVGALAHDQGMSEASSARVAANERKRVELEGTLRGVHTDDFAGKRSTLAYQLVTPTRVLDLSIGKLPHDVDPGGRVRVQGVLDGDTLAANSGDVESTGGTTTAESTGARKTAVILLNFATDTRRPWTTDQVRSTVFTSTGSVNAYFREQSFGRTSFTGKLRTDGDVFGWYTISSATSGCDVGTWSSAASSAARAEGVDLSGYQHIVYAWPYQSSCGWAGMAYVPGSTSWINGEMTLGVVAHELGHNLGVHHAGSLTCSDGGARVTLSSSCSFSEYGDPFDVMGNIASRHMNTWHKAKLGWYDAPRMVEVTSAGRYTLAPLETSSTAVQLLRVARGSTGDYYYLEYRRPFGFDNFALTDPVVNGVSVRLGRGYGDVTQSRLLDMVPSTSSFVDAALAAGKTFVDGSYGISIQTASVDSNQATVNVSFGGVPPPSDTTPPSAPSNLVAKVEAGPKIALSWSASTDEEGVAGYRVYRGATQIGTTTATTYTDSTVGSGASYTYTVRAYDAAGNLSAASNSVSVATVRRLVSCDFDGNGTSDIAFYRPSTGSWYIRGQAEIGWGATGGDLPVPADYDGDGKTDIAVFRPATGSWYIRGQGAIGWGADGGDVPVPADYDGDGKADIAVYRPSTGVWYVRGQASVGFGVKGDVPVPADYDGDGKTDIAVFRPATGSWYIRGQGAIGWGADGGDVPVPADYDGDGKADIAVFRPATGSWFIHGIGAIGWGAAGGDVPVPADYDGDGKADVAVYRPSTGVWYVRGQTSAGYGTSGDVPLPLPAAVYESSF